MKHTKVTVHEGLYCFLSESKSLNKTQNDQFEPVPIKKDFEDDLLLRIAPIIPKVRPLNSIK